jgi:hypothetical protein
VAIIETGASSEGYLEYLNQIDLENWDFPLSIHRTPYAGYDTGAYLYALQQFPKEDEFFFCHDSMRVRRPGVMADMARLAQRAGAQCIPWLVFRQNGYENEEQVQFVSRFCEDTTMPGFGIFGPIFYTTRLSLKRLPAKLFETLPATKNQQEAMERGWAVAFAQTGMRVRALDGDFYDGSMTHNQYPSFIKYRPKRA